MAAAMKAREAILKRVCSALGRNAGDPVAELGPARISIPELGVEERIGMFVAALEKLAGKTFVAGSRTEVRDYVITVVGGRKAISSRSRLLEECEIACPVSVDAQRATCAEATVGITSAQYALADTGTLVMLADSEEARLISLLPPVHIAVIERAMILTGLDELLAVAPLPAERTSSMVLITGPSRTADIEQILVRGVHGPGELHVVIA
jgi:L-lactate dehydrogenase complex protein LldG